MTFFGHPLHALTVHFPIALYLLGVLLTIAFLWRGQTDYEKFAYWSFILSWLATIVACLAGLIDQNRLAIDDPRRNDVNPHITGAIALLIINGLIIYMRFRWADVLTRYRWPYLGLMMLGIVAVIATGWFGAELVYGLRIGVR